MKSCCELIGCGEEGLAFRIGGAVIKRLYTSKTLEEVKSLQAQAHARIANPKLKAVWPIDYFRFRGVVFMVQPFVAGITAEEIMASAEPPKTPTARMIYDDRHNYWNDQTLNRSFLARLVSGGKTVEEAIAEGKAVYDYGPENFRIQDDEIIVVDVSFLGMPEVAKELRRTTNLGRRERIAVLRDRYRADTEALILEMQRLRMFDKYEKVQPVSAGDVGLTAPR
jgi:hypothetical protein